MIEKRVVAPQIVIYKNLLNNPKEIIDAIENNLQGESIWSKSKPWYSQGETFNQLFYRKDLKINDYDSNKIKKEKRIVSDIVALYDFIQKDYLLEYAKEKGNWPGYVKQWDKAFKELDPVHISIYKYSDAHFKQMEKNGLMLEYHVDEMPENSHQRIVHHLVTITFYLNDNYEGGELCFYDESNNKAYKYKPKSGDVTVFPSAAPFYHGVEHFSGADRYFMRIFIPYSSEGDEEWLKSEIFYNEDFIKEQEKKMDDFVANYTHAVTLQFPGEKVDNVAGKLVQLYEDIKVID